MKPTLRSITAGALIMTGAAFGTLAVAPAFATDPGTRTVPWLVTSGSFDNRFGTPQTLYTGSLECGTGLLQVDVYDTSTPEHAALVQALIDGGTLTSGQDTPVYLSNQDVELTPCATPTASTPVTTTPTTTTPPATKPPVGIEPTPTHSSDTPPTAHPTVPATAPATSPTTAPTSPSPSATSTAAKPTSERLAYTGTNTGPALALAALLLTGGLVLLAIRKKRA